MIRAKDKESNSRLASLLSHAPFSRSHPLEFERWIEMVEREPNETTRIMAQQAYIVYHEEQDPVSSRLYYSILGGTPPPGAYAYIGEIPAFIALAAASGVIGNLAYDALKNIVHSFLKPKSKITFEEKLSFEQYETVRKEFHKDDDARTDATTISVVEKEVGLKHRLLIERKWTKE